MNFTRQYPTANQEAEKVKYGAMNQVKFVENPKQRSQKNQMQIELQHLQNEQDRLIKEIIAQNNHIDSVNLHLIIQSYLLNIKQPLAQQYPRKPNNELLLQYKAKLENVNAL